MSYPTSEYGRFKPLEQKPNLNQSYPPNANKREFTQTSKKITFDPKDGKIHENPKFKNVIEVLSNQLLFKEPLQNEQPRSVSFSAQINKEPLFIEPSPTIELPSFAEAFPNIEPSIEESQIRKERTEKRQVIEIIKNKFFSTKKKIDSSDDQKTVTNQSSSIPTNEIATPPLSRKKTTLIEYTNAARESASSWSEISDVYRGNDKFSKMLRSYIQFHCSNWMKFILNKSVRDTLQDGVNLIRCSSTPEFRESVKRSKAEKIWNLIQSNWQFSLNNNSKIPMPCLLKEIFCMMDYVASEKFPDPKTRHRTFHRIVFRYILPHVMPEGIDVEDQLVYSGIQAEINQLVFKLEKTPKFAESFFLPRN